LRGFRLFRRMKTPTLEAKEAQDDMSLDERNAELDMKTQRLQLTTGNGNGNGSTRTPVTSGRNGGGKNE